MEEGLIIHTDGGSRGNPGPAACAFVAEENGSEVYKESKYLGIKTNNFAEYSGVTLALQWIAKEVPITNYQFPIIFYLDSELVVKQLNGLYKIKNEVLKKLNDEIKRVIKEKN